jgi:hypothetical protein
MAQQLTRGMFGMGDVRVDPHVSRALSGHCVTQDLIHNGGWHNKAGEWLGWGDLSPADLRRVMEVLEEGEMFVVLYESDRPRVQGQPDTTPAYLAEKAAYVVVKGDLYYVDRHGYSTGKETVDMLYGLTAKVLTPEAFARMLGVEAPVA